MQGEQQTDNALHALHLHAVSTPLTAFVGLGTASSSSRSAAVGNAAIRIFAIAFCRAATCVCDSRVTHAELIFN